MKILGSSLIQIKGKKDDGKFYFVYTKGTDKSVHEGSFLPTWRITEKLQDIQKEIQDGQHFEINFSIKYGKPTAPRKKKEEEK